jgi:hypothetical protein
MRKPVGSLEEIVKNSPYENNKQLDELMNAKARAAEKLMNVSEEARILVGDIGRFLFRLKHNSPPDKWSSKDEELFQISQKKIAGGFDKRIGW